MSSVTIKINSYSNEVGSWIRPQFDCVDCGNFAEGSIDPLRISMPPGGWRIYKDGSVRCGYCAKHKREAENARTQ